MYELLFDTGYICDNDMHALHAEVLEEVQVNQGRLTELILPRKEPESNNRGRGGIRFY